MILIFWNDGRQTSVYFRGRSRDSNTMVSIVSEQNQKRQAEFWGTLEVIDCRKGNVPYSLFFSWRTCCSTVAFR